MMGSQGQCDTECKKPLLPWPGLTCALYRVHLRGPIGQDARNGAGRQLHPEQWIYFPEGKKDAIPATLLKSLAERARSFEKGQGPQRARHGVYVS